MAKITFITQDNIPVTVEGESGSVMALAVDNNIAGIDGDCGGVCSCATCHVHVAKDQFSLVGEASEIEKDMLELDDSTDDYSRLCCQIDITDELDGLVLTVAG
ncbi:2Fe-2S iron-sulfur cluster-binding protein [Paraglaciecola sp. 20A4]|uniref:2Fe-2S iron-sulfur cluster-binding protein n=1 Tax=Paraglaciecola sp. 20A4 TaxID=2687288 RepID=UPI00140785F4